MYLVINHLLFVGVESRVDAAYQVSRIVPKLSSKEGPFRHKSALM